MKRCPAVLVLLLSLAAAETWTETSRGDFVDGEVDAQMYVSYRAQLEPDTGCMEFYARFDVDNNGFYDLACSDDSGPHLTLYMGDATGYSPNRRLQYDVTSGGNVDLADLDLDGHAELIHSGWRSGRAVIYHGTPAGPSPIDTTVLSYTGEGEDVNVYDLDKDGYLDIILGSSDGNLYIYWGSATGHRTANRTLINLGYAIGHNTDIADFDKDGWGDISVTMWTYNQVAVVYWGPGRTPRNTVWLPFRWNNAHGITLADYNNDQWLDIALTGYDTVLTAYFYWGSDSGFRVANFTALSPGKCYGGSSAADWNGDGWVDLVYLRGNWIQGGRWKPTVYLNLGAPPYFSDGSRMDLGTDTLNASGGFIADLNFDGAIDIFVNNMLPDDSSYVLWGPDHMSHTGLPAHSDHHGVFREPGSSYNRAQVAQYYSSIYSGPDSVILGGTSLWTAFEPPGSRVQIAYRSGDTPTPDPSWTSFTTVSGNGGQLPNQILGNRYLQYRARFSYTRPCFLPNLEEINTVVVRTPPVLYDVGVERILAPGDTVDGGTIVTPVAVVRNWGNQLTTFPVHMRIGGPYRESVSVSLLPGAADTVSFALWTANPIGNHRVLCYTAFPLDEIPSNDTALGTVTVVPPPYPDVGPVAILAPRDKVDSGAVVRPRALVHNFGNVSVTFPVYMRIGGSYVESTATSLAPGAEDTVSFALWTATPVGVQSTICATGLAGDQNPANDSIRDSVTVDPPPLLDVGPVAIIAPTGIVTSGTAVIPQVVVRNFGDLAASFPVHLRIGGSYAESTAANLVPGAIDTLSFAVWIATPVGTHAVVCNTALPGDGNPANDTIRDSVTVIPPPQLDVGPVAILAPTGIVTSGTVVTPQVVVHNFGDQNASFPVELRIGGSYAESTAANLAPGEDDTVSFAPWTAAPTGVLATVCWTRLAGDQNPSNDTIRDSVTVIPPPLHDVGPIAILAPTGVVDSGAIVTPQAIVHNFGNLNADFPVHLSIGPGYSDSIAVSLAPGTDDTVSFAPWTASPLGVQGVVCYTLLAGDQNPSNDTIVGSVTVSPPPQLDVAPIAILAPTGVVDSGALVVPQVVVYNFGELNADFPVHLVIGGQYSESVAVSLAPGTGDTVSFGAWTATPLGVVGTVCYTLLVGDQNPSNDTIRDSVTVRPPPLLDVGPVAIIAPVGTADSGTVVTPAAVVHNFGNQPAAFPVHFTIGTAYSDSVSVNLAPGSDDTVSFAPWTAEPLGTHAVVCYTALPQDQNPANDTLRGSVTVVPRPNLDVGPIAILAPAGAVDSGSVHTPRAIVHNYGNLNASFPVYFTIGSQYSESTATSLAPGGDDTVSFAPWTAVPVGTHSVVCFTGLPGDERPQNDTVTGSVTVAPPPIHDIGALTVLAPTGTLMDGDTVRPRALIRNFGTASESYFEVRFRVGTVYDQYAGVITPLAPGADAEVSFPPWVALAGDYAVSCSTQLTRDANRLNDKATASVHVSPSASLSVEADVFDRIRVGAKLTFSFYALLQGEQEELVTLSPVAVPAGWNAWLVDSLGDRSISDLGVIQPGQQTRFGLRVEAPPANLPGILDSLPTEVFLVRGRIAADPTITDSALLTLQLVPDLEIHNYPNPVKTSTRFVIGVPAPGKVTLTVYNRAGERVRRVLDNADMDARIYVIPWDATNDVGEQLARGTYEYVFEHSGAGKANRLIRKLVIAGE